MKTNKRFEGALTRSFGGLESIRVIDEETRTVELSFSSEEPITRWGDDEILSHKNGAVQLDRLNTTGCLLFNHNRDYVVGKIVSAAVKKKRGIATVEFDKDEASEVIFQKVKNGTLRGVSVGYRILSMDSRIVKINGRSKTIYTATLWEPTEISIVSVPADTSVGVGRSMAAEGYRPTNIVNHKIKINENILKLKEVSDK
ncbi:MAG: HK97 family phage prohead protease [bacterium]|nr:HK97 family phage prohead protease [bacterium]